MLHETQPAEMVKQNGEHELPGHDKANQFSRAKPGCKHDIPS